MKRIKFLRNRNKQKVASPMLAFLNSSILLLIPLLMLSCAKKENSDLQQVSQKGKVEDSLAVSAVDGDVVGKLIVGYQGWFGASGDASPFNSWRHWAGTGTPGPNNQNFELWPDVRENTTTYQTNYANLGNGSPAKLFSSWNDQTVDLHFKWMSDYGIDCAALQRFGNHMANDPRDRDFKNGLVQKERAAAENHRVKFFIWYDISGWTNFQTEIKTDWTNIMSAHVASPMYAKQEGKPVICLWGIGVSNRPGDVNAYSDVINWFKARGCYVIVGTARGWRENTTIMPAFNQADMISPWTVGTYSNLTGVDNYATVMQDDKAHCDAQGQDYLPVAFPGFAWSNWKPGSPQNEIPRLHGDFMWRQFANIRDKGIKQTYIAMFDEYDEATAIAKAAENASMTPTNQYFLTLNADGITCSADFYLRLTQDGAKMIKQESPLVWNHPTSHQ